MKSLKDFYDDTAEQWAELWYKNETMLPVLQEFLNCFLKKPIILDLCCGTGYESMRLKGLGAEVIGIDFSEKSIDIAKKKNKDICFFVEDIFNDYSYIGKVDGVVFLAGLVHISENQIYKVVENLDKVLKKDGFILISSKIGNGLMQTKRIVEGIEYERPFYGYTIQQVTNYLSNDYSLIKVIDGEPDWFNIILKKKG